MPQKYERIRWGFILLLILVPLIMTVAGRSFVHAQVSQTVSVSAVVPSPPPLSEPDTIIVFRGIAYPSSTVTISRDGFLISALTTNAQAAFEVSATVDPGTYTFTIVGIDGSGIEGKVSNFTLTLSKSTTTTISGIFLGPTIAIDDSSLAAGEAATLSGTTAPNSEVNVTLTSLGIAAAGGVIKTSVKIASADSNGRWTKVYQADDLETGTYEAKAQATEPVSSSVSEFSKSVSFVVVGGAPDACSAAVNADINCDGRVDLVDFSILLFSWGSKTPANPRSDINRDGIVNLTDFSILLYYWTG